MLSKVLKKNISILGPEVWTSFKLFPTYCRAIPKDDGEVREGFLNVFYYG